MTTDRGEQCCGQSSLPVGFNVFEVLFLSVPTIDDVGNRMAQVHRVAREVGEAWDVEIPMHGDEATSLLSTLQGMSDFVAGEERGPYAFLGCTDEHRRVPVFVNTRWVQSIKHDAGTRLAKYVFITFVLEAHQRTPSVFLFKTELQAAEFARNISECVSQIKKSQ
jgi:hypothetical protein